MNVLIREYKNNDKLSLNNLLNEHYQGINIDSLENSKTALSLVAVSDDKVVGHLHIDIINDEFRNIRFGYISYVCVASEYQNKGIGTLLMKEIDKIASKENLTYYELTSRASRQAAHHLYLKNGFVIRESTIFKKTY
ncbi:MAG: GNAT family N-acetyltransferase [bacterium]|nr:GNAT family N-acetyltransferase [bacterium]